MSLKIGITVSETKYVNYPPWVKGNRDIELIELSHQADNLMELHQCDGVVFTGGIDIHPGFHLTNYSLHYPQAPEEFSRMRDEFELTVLEKALERKLPILGICRGLQLFNCFFGGTLILDLGDKNFQHQNINNIDKHHLVNVHPNTLLSLIANVSEGEVNSAHHQAIDKVGKGLKVSAHAADGTIEAIELEDTAYPFFIGVQWHPERVPDLESPLSKNILDQFYKAAEKKHEHY